MCVQVYVSTIYRYMKLASSYEISFIHLHCYIRREVTGVMEHSTGLRVDYQEYLGNQDVDP